MKKKKKHVIGSVLILEIVIIAVIFSALVVKGKVSFRVTDTMAGMSDTSSGTGEDTEIVKENKEEVASHPKGETEQGQGSIDSSTEKTTDEASSDSEPSGHKSGEPVEGSYGEGDEGIPDDKDGTDLFDTITISAAGDVTLGRDEKYGYERSFDHEFELQKGDYGYFFRNVKDIFESDDLTIVNLETTLTTAKKKADKKFRFKADPSYVEILKEGDIEVVSIANNHTMDYLEKGYQDTLTTLQEAGIGYFGYEHKYITEIRGIKVGILGYTSFQVSEKQKKEMKQAMEELRKEGAKLVLVMFHWGIERDYYPNSLQREIAHEMIDSGADLVLGSHPHVVQGIEEYRGKKIIYSLGNFCFGGNKNPGDKDTFIYVHKFNFKNGELISEDGEVIPCSVSSVKERNNYQPAPLIGEDKDRLMKKIEKYSKLK